MASFEEPLALRVTKLLELSSESVLWPFRAEKAFLARILTTKPFLTRILTRIHATCVARRARAPLGIRSRDKNKRTSRDGGGRPRGASKDAMSLVAARARKPEDAKRV